MARNIQQYLNNLVNKSRVFYLDLNNDKQNKQLEGEITDLKEFKNLKGINASNNEFTNLNFLDTLPNKDKLVSLNLFGNQIKEVDFAELFTKFPKLEKINLTANPLSAKNLNNLSSEQFSNLITKIRDGKIKINSFRGTIIMDLLAYAQQLSQQGNNQQQQNAQYLQTLIQGSSVKTEKQPDNSNNTLLLVGGLAVAVISAVAIGYLLGKKRKNNYE
jgi:hypothetical protein